VSESYSEASNWERRKEGLGDKRDNGGEEKNRDRIL